MVLSINAENNCYPRHLYRCLRFVHSHQKCPAKISSANLAAVVSLFWILAQFDDNHVCQQPDKSVHVGFLFVFFSLSTWASFPINVLFSSSLFLSFMTSFLLSFFFFDFVSFFSPLLSFIYSVSFSYLPILFSFFEFVSVFPVLLLTFPCGFLSFFFSCQISCFLLSP